MNVETKFSHALGLHLASNVINGECQVACRLGGVSVFVTGPKGHGFNPSRDDGFLRAIKIHSTPSFGWEVKREAPCRILRRLKTSLHVSQILICKILTSSSIPPTHCQIALLVGLPDNFVNESGVFPSRRSKLTYHPGDEQ
jgi:hypothetical protein